MGLIVHNSEFVSWAKEAASRGEKFHACLCDPPYGLEFMGKEWDKFDIRQPGDPTLPMSKAGPFRRAKVRHAGSPGYGKGKEHEAKLGFQREVQKWGEALLSILYPGALVFMFAGPRMWHRLAAGMEDAGFHLWDTIMWLHGQGFPKARNVSKMIDEAQGIKGKIIGIKKRGDIQYALKNKIGYLGDPANKNNTKAFGYGEEILTAPGSDISAPWTGHKTPQLKPAWEPILCFRTPYDETYAELAIKYGVGCLNIDAGRVGGRFPANLLLDKQSAEQLDAQTGVLTGGDNCTRTKDGAWSAGDVIHPGIGKAGEVQTTYGDSGGASRFFYVAKPSQKERNAGLEERNNHPTVKPIDLNRYLASLLLPPSSVANRRLLIPFSGSGSEMIGAALAGWDEIVGIEMDAEYCKLAEARISHWVDDSAA